MDHEVTLMAASADPLRLPFRTRTARLPQLRHLYRHLSFRPVLQLQPHEIVQLLWTENAEQIYISARNLAIAAERMGSDTVLVPCNGYEVRSGLYYDKGFRTWLRREVDDGPRVSPLQPLKAEVGRFHSQFPRWHDRGRKCAGPGRSLLVEPRSLRCLDGPCRAGRWGGRRARSVPHGGCLAPGILRAGPARRPALQPAGS